MSTNAKLLDTMSVLCSETSRDNIFEEEIAESDEEIDPDTRSQLTSKIILGDVTIPEPPLRRKVG